MQWHGAYTHSRTAAVLNEAGRYAGLAEMALGEMQPYLYNEGVYHFNKEEYGKADYYFARAVEVDPKDYEALLGSSFVALVEKDTGRAIGVWRGMSESFASGENDSMPAAIEESHQLLSEYQGEVVVEEVVLLDTLVNGSMESETAKEEIIPFPKAIKLEKSELTVYQGQPLKQQEAARLFEDILSKFPEDVKTALAYAGLLQFQEKEAKAMKLYQQVLLHDPTNVEAHKQLGVFHLNMAVESHERAEQIVGQPTPSLLEQGRLHLEKAYPHFQKLDTLEREKDKWLETLYLISHQLKTPEAAAYRIRWEAKQK